MRRTIPIPSSHYKVRRSSAGLGIFALETLLPGMYLEYTGTRVPTPEANKKHGARYLFEINRSWTIDGSVRSNTARYFNHSCHPNCESVVSKTRVYIVVICEVHAGEELTYDYGEEYVNEFIRPHGCRCRKCVTKKIRPAQML
jgi:uncharacterized protein